MKQGFSNAMWKNSIDTNTAGKKQFCQLSLYELERAINGQTWNFEQQII